MYMCVVACIHTYVDVSQQMQTHSIHTQTTYTAHHTSIPTVVVSLMIHDYMYVYENLDVHVQVYGYLDIWMCMCCAHVYVHVYVFLT